MERLSILPSVLLSVRPSVHSATFLLSAVQMQNYSSRMFLQSQEGGAGFAETLTQTPKN